jgi:hypothetical protein
MRSLKPGIKKTALLGQGGKNLLFQGFFNSKRVFRGWILDLDYHLVFKGFWIVASDLDIWFF